jgi:protease-4
VFATRGAKPILCSMGDVAASGGYFIAAGCDTIFAEPMTITGSIGIFYGKFELSGLLRKLGITTATHKRGQHADVESFVRPYTEEERALLLEKLSYMYGRFVGAVAEGRRMKKEQVDAVGRGRVWTGEMA